jgi:hypothetical protein
MSAIRMADSLAAVKEANQLWQELENLPMLADNQATMAEELYLTGEFEQALNAAQEGLRISEKIRSPWGMSYALTTFGLVTWSAAISTRHPGAPGRDRLREQANFFATQVGHRLIIGWMYLTLGERKVQRPPGNKRHKEVLFLWVST